MYIYIYIIYIPLSSYFEIQWLIMFMEYSDVLSYDAIVIDAR